MLSGMLDSWSALYSNHASLRTAIEFAHVGGLLAGGGSALAADLAIMRGGDPQLLKHTHVLVVAGLVALFASGVLLFAADVDTYLYSRVYWIKMALIVVLLVNGIVLWRAERRAAAGDNDAWTVLHRTAIVSLLVWFATTLAGAALPNIG
ncbi:MAG TPA: hypothetical protein VHZ73_06265 [Vicinamibacterales bacterium]|jgi:hypothetical protein|nr:hypothetical protein [Vicinamibacterales bacterium]